MQTFTEFTARHLGRFFWTQSLGDGTVEVIVYSSEHDLEADTDNSLAIARATVRDDRLKAAVAALSAAFGGRYDPDESSYIVAVTDDGDDDPEAAASLAEIQRIVAPYGCTAGWTGHGNTDGDGSSTSDVCVEVRS